MFRTDIAKNRLYYFVYYMTKNIDCRTDEEIINYFNISLKQYQQKGLEYNGFIEDKNKELYFNTRKDAQQFINGYLESLRILKKLVGE
ncbi:MAG: hypothetical protein ACOCP8_01865 [archaeon]